MNSELTYKSEPINRYEFLLNNLVKPKFEAIHHFKVKSHEVDSKLHALDVRVMIDSKILSSMNSYFQDQWTMSDEEQMGIDKILAREHEIIEIVFEKLSKIPNLKILAPQHQDRLGIFSFYIDDLHYNLGVKLLNDRFGIQTRGGCSCAGTYGHFLLHVDQNQSKELLAKMDEGCLIERPGWIRMSIHPTTTDEEVRFICEAIKELAVHCKEWAKDYSYDMPTNEFLHKSFVSKEKDLVRQWFNLDA